MLYLWLTLFLVADGVAMLILANVIKGPRRGLFRALAIISFAAAALTGLMFLIFNS